MILSGKYRSKWWLQCTEAGKWRDYWERRSKLHRKGSIFSHCRKHCQCCKQRFEVISISIEWHGYCYVRFRVSSGVQNNKCQQSMGDIWNSWTPETYTSLPVRRDLMNRKNASAAWEILTGCDVTSKTGSKSAACKACQEKHLYNFGEDGRWQKSILFK